MSDQDLIAVGRVVNTHGLRGEMRVQMFNRDSTAVLPGADIILRHRGLDSARRVRSVRPHKRVLLVVLEGCDSIDAAETLVGGEIYVRKADLPVPGPNEVYHFELEGMRVVTTAGEDIGTVEEVLAVVGSNDICVVRSGTREYMIPMIADIVKEVDREAGRLVVEPLPGLFD